MALRNATADHKVERAGRPSEREGRTAVTADSNMARHYLLLSAVFFGTRHCCCREWAIDLPFRQAGMTRPWSTILRESENDDVGPNTDGVTKNVAQMLLQTVALASLWNDNEAKREDLFVAFSILNSVFSVSWETMSALDRSRETDKQQRAFFGAVAFFAFLSTLDACR